MLTIKEIQSIAKKCGYVENQPLPLMTLITVVIKAIEEDKKQKQ
jgi:2-methylisocitrate lyase-like PEP mutase family enzyme